MLPDRDKNEATTPDAAAEYLFAGYRVDARQRRLLNPEGEIQNLSSRAFDTLLALLEQQGEVLSKSTLMSIVWPNVVVEENNLNQAVSSLRKALGDAKNESRFILTVPGRGYSFIATVDRVANPAATGTPLSSEAASAQAHTAGEARPGPDQHAGADRALPLPPPGSAWQWPRALLVVPLLALLLAAGLLLRKPDPEPAAATATGIAPQDIAFMQAGVIRNSIAVLPLSNLNPDEENSLFALGLHDEVINQLTKISSLSVIARSSVLPLVEQELSTAEIARVLRVESVMSGTLLFAGENARVNLQLVNPASGLTLWSGTYEADTHNLSDMISIQGDIALHVARALEAEIRQSERERIASLPTSSFKAYRYNLAAKNAHYQQDFAQQWSLAGQALKLDPDYYDALSTFASVNNIVVATPLPGMDSQKHFRLALESADRMIQLQPDNGAGYAIKAVALGTVPDWNGVAEMKATLERLGTPLADRAYIALLLLCIGEFEEAISIYQANLVTEPLNLFGRGFLMAALELSGDPAAADAEYRIGDELNPSWWGDQVNIFLALGRGEPLQDIDELFIPEGLKQVLQQASDHEALARAVQAYVVREDKVSAESLYYAAFAAQLGDQELALDLLRLAFDDVWTSLFWAWLPVFDETRQLASFKALLRESGIVDYWRQHGWPDVCQPAGDDFNCNWSARPQTTLN